MEFSLYDFSTDWTYIAFDFQMKTVVFGPEQEQIRTIPGIAIRIAENEIAAFSRICPREGCVLQIVDPARFNCGCNSNTGRCCACVPDVKTPSWSALTTTAFSIWLTADVYSQGQDSVLCDSLISCAKANPSR